MREVVIASAVRTADSMFRTVSLSRLPLLRALARYHQSSTLIEREQCAVVAGQAVRHRRDHHQGEDPEHGVSLPPSHVSLIQKPRA